MSKKAKSLLKISATFLGTVLGAGFASGSELWLFFARFPRALLGAALAGVLFSVLGARILGCAQKLSEKTFTAYLKTVFPKPLALFFNTAAQIFLWLSFSVMLSGVGAFFEETLSLPRFVGVLSADLLCFLVFCFGTEGIAALNLFLTPFMLLGMLYVSFYVLFTANAPVFSLSVNRHALFLPYALLYVGYNMLSASAVLVPLSSLAPDSKTAARGGIVGGAGLTILCLLATAALLVSDTKAFGALPLLSLSRGAGTLCYVSYSFVLLSAMLTTAVGTGFSAAASLAFTGAPVRVRALFVCLCSLPLAFVDFSVLMARTYVFFGVLGLFFIGVVLWRKPGQYANFSCIYKKNKENRRI